MLVVVPAKPFGYLGAILSALIAAVSLIGLTVHKDFYAGKRRRDFYCFYTNLSNLLVLIYFSLVAPRLYASANLRAMIPHAEFSLMMSIMLTFMVFHHLLFPSIFQSMKTAPRDHEFAIVCTDNLIVHYLVPWLVFAYWLLCSPGKSLLSLRDAFGWTIIPLCYIGYIFLRAQIHGEIEEVGCPYPYPFLDVQRLGLRRVLSTCALLYGACVVVGLAIIALTQLSFAYLGSGHAFILI